MRTPARANPLSTALMHASWQDVPLGDDLGRRVPTLRLSKLLSISSSAQTE